MHCGPDGWLGRCGYRQLVPLRHVFNAISFRAKQRLVCACLCLACTSVEAAGMRLLDKFAGGNGYDCVCSTGYEYVDSDGDDDDDACVLLQTCAPLIIPFSSRGNATL